MSDDSNSDDPRTPADKDSTGKNHNKKNEKSYNAASLTPMGSVAVDAKRTVTVSMITEEMPARDELVNLDREDINLEEKFKGLKVLMRINYDGPTEKGIDGGRITRLTVTEGEIGSEKIAAHFDNGKWTRKPETVLEIQARMRAQKEHNGLEMPEVKPAFDQSNKHKLKP
jgi:hypothetical protein